MPLAPEDVGGLRGGLVMTKFSGVNLRVPIEKFVRLTSLGQSGAEALRAMLDCIGDPGADDHKVAKILVENEGALRAFLREATS